MIYLTIALAAALIAVGVLAYRLIMAGRALTESRRECLDMREDRAIRQNLDHMLSARNAEIRRLRAELSRLRDATDDSERALSEVNLKHFDESGRRVLAEKDAAAQRMKAELLERQLNEEVEKRKKLEGQLAVHEAALKDAEARLKEATAPQNVRARRARRATGDLELDQVNMFDLIAGGKR